MKRIALRAGKALAAAASTGVLLVSSCGESSLAHSVELPATRLPITVLERSCLYPDDAELTRPWYAAGSDGTVVELWCGSRVEVSGGQCRARLADALTVVPCVTEPRRSGALSPGLGNSVQERR